MKAPYEELCGKCRHDITCKGYRRMLIRRNFYEKITPLCSCFEKKEGDNKMKNNEILCKTCLHLKVCSLKDKLETIQETVDNITVVPSTTLHNGDILSSKKLSDFEWLEPVVLKCVHYLENKKLENVIIKDNKWQYSEYWEGNHDKRIEDAKCPVCAYHHPTVKGPDALPDCCPLCNTKLSKR